MCSPSSRRGVCIEHGLHRLSGGLCVLCDPARGGAIPDSVRPERLARHPVAAADGARAGHAAATDRLAAAPAAGHLCRSGDRCRRSACCSAPIFHAAAAAGAVLDQQGGYASAAIYDPHFQQEAALFETLFSQFAALTLFTGPGLPLLFGFFTDAWVLWPPGRWRVDLVDVFRQLALARPGRHADRRRAARQSVARPHAADRCRVRADVAAREAAQPVCHRTHRQGVDPRRLPRC